MSLNGPIISIEDDEDDQYLIGQILKELGVSNPVHFYSNGLQALNYLKTTIEKPFIILCDVNMHIMNGIELRGHIESNPYLREKSIPFVFLSTSDNKELVKEVYKGTVQGFFKKEANYELFKKHISLVIQYWSVCLHPNNV